MKRSKMVRIIVLAIGFTLLLASVTVGETGEHPPVLQPLVSSGINIVVNGEALAGSVPPIIEQDRILIPVRSLAEQLGAHVEWLAAENKVMINKDQDSLELTINEPSAEINGEKINMEVPARIIKNRTYVPLRFISEALHAQVTWMPQERTALVEFDPANKPGDANIKINNHICSPKQLTVTGTARVWEANVLYEVTDKNDKVLFNGFTTASIGAPDWGDFSFSIEGDLSEAYILRVFTESAKDGSRMDMVEYFLKPFGTAQILSKEPGSILVEGVLGGYSDQPTRFYFAISPETIITDANNIQLSESQLQPGDELQIWISYPGVVLESWPAQAGAGKIVRTNKDIDWQGLAADYNPPAIDDLLTAIKNSPVSNAGKIEITDDIKRDFNQMGEDYRLFFMPEVNWFDFESTGAAISYMLFTWTGEFGSFPESLSPYQAEARLRKVFAAPDDVYPPLIHQTYPKFVQFDGKSYSPWPESYNTDTMVYDLVELKQRNGGDYIYYTAIANEYGFDVKGYYEPGVNEKFLLAKAKALGLDYDSALEKLLTSGQITDTEKRRTYQIEFRVDHNGSTPKIVAVDWY